MSCSIYLGWGLLVPAGFCLLNGFMVYRAMPVLGYDLKNTLQDCVRILLPEMVLFLVWSMIDIPLPIVYILHYLGKIFRFFQKGSRTKALFFINLTHLMAMALQMILIGVISLVASMPVNEILMNPFWRIFTISFILTVSNLIAWMVPNWSLLPSILRTQSESGEVRPFMAFLWLCTVFLLLDSVLCFSELDWDLLPLFLIASTVLMEFLLVRFLRHIYSILKVHYLEEENKRLTTELERQNETAARWRRKSALDPMTGVFTRWYIMERVEEFLRAKVEFSLVFIDLDHLKEINDREGHHAGDQYLVQFTKMLGGYLRQSDIFGRVGGDEFVILLPGCREETAKERMEAARNCLAENPGQPLFFSYGVTCVKDHMSDDAKQMIERADQAMYRDKAMRELGR